MDDGAAQGVFARSDEANGSLRGDLRCVRAFDVRELPYQYAHGNGINPRTPLGGRLSPLEPGKGSGGC